MGICVQMCNICQDCIRLWVQENCTHIKEIMPVLMIIMILCKTIVSAKSIRHPKIQNYLMEKYFDIYIYIYIYNIIENLFVLLSLNLRLQTCMWWP